jgi:hypothetical protein
MSQVERYTLRRPDHGIYERDVIEALLQSALIGRVAVIADGEPYVVPMNFVYQNSKIWIHGASEGRLISAVKSNPRVCFEIDEYVATLPHPVLCEFDTAYASVVCVGTARVLDSVEERTAALKLITRKYAPEEQVDALRESTVEKFRGAFESHTAVIEIAVDAMTGKRQNFNVQDFSPKESKTLERLDLSSVGNIDEIYHHYDCVVAPNRPLELPGAVLKWYEVRPPQLIIPLSLIRETRQFLEREASAGRLDLGNGLGFVLLHYTEKFIYLVVCPWKDANEIWETQYIRENRQSAEFRKINLGVDGPTLCLWELAPVWHEREAWAQYLRSQRDEAAKRTYLSDQCSGLK